MLTNQLLIIGAGPYGLATAAYAKQLGIDYAILGKPMEFWRDQMPKGMLLRSSGTGHLDPMEIYTLQRYLASKDIKREPASPLPLSLFVEYADWLVEQVGIILFLDCLLQ
ncbi:MAG: hypothetical protein ABSA33_06790 [Candidatus Micrarchaeaceae archaeon]